MSRSELQTCPVCGQKEIAGMRGLTAHVRLKHPVEYPAWKAGDLEPPRKKKPQRKKKAKTKPAKKPATKKGAKSSTTKRARATEGLRDPDAVIPEDELQAEEEALVPIIISDEEEFLDLYLG